MKSIIIITALTLLSFVSFAQSKPPQTADTLVTDTTGLIQLRDLNELSNTLLSDLPMRYGNPILTWLQQRFTQRANEYQLRQKQKLLKK